jgi:hypothetical protein
MTGLTGRKAQVGRRGLVSLRNQASITLATRSVSEIWGGRSDWQVLSENHGGAINHAIPGMLDFVIGDFVGDGRIDCG